MTIGIFDCIFIVFVLHILIYNNDEIVNESCTNRCFKLGIFTILFTLFITVHPYYSPEQMKDILYNRFYYLRCFIYGFIFIVSGLYQTWINLRILRRNNNYNE